MPAFSSAEWFRAPADFDSPLPGDPMRHKPLWPCVQMLRIWEEALGGHICTGDLGLPIRRIVDDAVPAPRIRDKGATPDV